MIRKAKAVLRGDMHVDEVSDAAERQMLVSALKMYLRHLNKQAKSSPRMYGRVSQVSAADYIEQVSLAGVGVWVVVLVYDNAREDCRFLNAVPSPSLPKP